jgi:chaperonin cofactor prefoldin
MARAAGRLLLSLLAHAHLCQHAGIAEGRGRESPNPADRRGNRGGREPSKRANRARGRGGESHDPAGRPRRHGGREANAASQRADEAVARAEAAESDAAQWSDLLNEPQTLAKTAADAETAAQLAATEAKELAESLGRLRKFSDDLDAIATEEAQIRARNVGRFLMPEEDFRRLKQLSENAAFIRKQMAGEIEAARNLTPELQEALRKATPFKQIEGAAARRQAFLDSIPEAQKGPGGTYIDYITGEARPLSQLAPDHVVSVQEIFQMPGFKRLPVADQIEILDMPANLRFLERGLNSSKGGRPLSAWLSGEAELAPFVTPQKLAELAQIEADARKALAAEIAKRRARMLGL